MIPELNLDHGPNDVKILGHMYRVTIENDDSPDEPESDCNVVTAIELNGTDGYLHDFKPFRLRPGDGMQHSTAEAGKLSDLAETAISEARHSEAAIARWLRLSGAKGLCALSRGHDGSIGLVSLERPEHPVALATMMQDRWEYAGFAFIEPELAAAELSDGADYHNVVATTLDEWNAYHSGDVFGYRIEHTESGDEIGSCYGYYGWDTNIEYVSSEIAAEIATDAAQRNFETVQRETQRDALAFAQAGIDAAVDAARKSYAAKMDAQMRAWLTDNVGLLPVQVSSLVAAQFQLVRASDPAVVTPFGLVHYRPEKLIPPLDVTGLTIDGETK